MLLAEINGKRCEAIVGDEDYLTSAVFGHLRYVDDEMFWMNVFRRASSAGSVRTTLSEELEQEAFTLQPRMKPRATFWPRYTEYGEPDLLLQFGGANGRSLALIIEVKLNSGKSETGPNDQLKRYFDLLHDKKALSEVLFEDPLVALIYLTEQYAAEELRESLAWSAQPLASSRMFNLQWQDVLEAARELSLGPDTLLGEVARFLHGRNLERFRGFEENFPYFASVFGSFYSASYFTNVNFHFNAGAYFYG